MLDRFPHELVTDLIGLLYDSALTPSVWPEALGQIYKALGFSNIALSINSLTNGAMNNQVVLGIEPHWLERMPLYGQDLIDLWGGPARIAALPLYEPMLTTQIADPQIFASNPYVTDWSAPQGLVDALGLGLHRDTKMVATLGMGIHRDRGEVGPIEMDVVRTLAPHLRRSIVLGELLERRVLEVITFEALLDTIAVPILLLAENAFLVHANLAARQLLQAGSLMVSVRGILRLTDPEAERRLLHCLDIAAHQETALGRKGITVPVHGLEGEAAAATVLPLATGPVRSALVPTAIAAVFLSPHNQTETPLDAFAALHDLTPAEARIAELIASGLTPNEISAEIGIARTTVRTHLQSALEKTNSRRQLELALLLRSFRPPV
ncbi:helix-turn-helix transcriptional regulator [Devosia submarina]|uniref:helix-turn-helix transcriptional regulator n=1 Tax=Devosia submarina TaxID=1173082 RepID=UPI00130094E6|nr:LuxR C-terminal-related transcriptional regulator [Devosia submarina]